MSYLLAEDDPIIRSMTRTGLPPWAEDEDDDEDLEEEDRDPEESALIEITRLPAIVENLEGLRESWEHKAAEAASLVCTAESVQVIKKMRADMRKEFDEADSQRKAVKARLFAPWEEIEATWKECIAEPFKRADSAYKAQIDDFEDSLKASCKASLKSYFDELCLANGVDFLSLDQAMGYGGLRIGMADANAKTPKRLMDGLTAVVEQIAKGAAMIQQMDDAPEIMEEFKRSFDVGAAVAAVQGRKRRIEAEREAAERRKAEQERAKEAAAKVEAVAPPQPVELPRQEKIFPEFTFTVFDCTRSQLLRLREYLKQEGIRYE